MDYYYEPSQTIELMKSEPLFCAIETKSEWAHISWKDIEKWYLLDKLRISFYEIVLFSHSSVLVAANATKAPCSQATWLLQCILKAVNHGDQNRPLWLSGIWLKFLSWQWKKRFRITLTYSLRFNQVWSFESIAVVWPDGCSNTRRWYLRPCGESWASSLCPWWLERWYFGKMSQVTALCEDYINWERNEIW